MKISCQSLRERALLEFLYCTGCRVGEVEKINIEDHNWENCSAIVNGKGSKQREVYFTTECKVWLKKYLASRGDSCKALFVMEDMRMMQPEPSLEIIKQLFLNAGLERHWEKYNQLVKPGFFLEPTIAPEDEIPIGKSKIGGNPDIPMGFTWPDWEGHPMSFIAQINLEEFPMSSIDHNYPATGILHFFYPCDDDVLFSDEFLYDAFPKDQNVVLYTSDLSDLKRIKADPDIISFSSCLMNLKFENMIPVNSLINEKRLFDNDEEAYVLYENFCSSYYEMCNHDIGFRFFGYINGLQYDFQDADTELLFQVDTNDEIGMQWDLSGLLYFYITKEDLLNRNFDEVFTDRVGT